MNETLEKQIEYYDSLDTFDREQLRLGILLQNANSREGQRLYKLAQEKRLLR